jgi:hypothetical protein
LLNGDGINGSTSIVDSSGSPKTITSAATIDTSTYKFGTGAIRTSPTGSKFAAITNTSDLDFQGDYTVECWVYMVSTQSYGGIFANGISGNSSGVGQFVLTVNTNSITTYINGTTASVISNTSLSLNTWTHLAVTMSGTTLTIWVNGVNTGSTTYSGSRGTPYTYSTLGRWYHGIDSYYFDGYIDDFRVTKGLARYTSTFTPPTAALPKSSGMLVGTLANPATDIAALRSAGITTNGMYYFKNATSGATTFQAYCKFNYIDGNDWYLLLKVHNQGDMTSGSTYWTNTSLYNETDSNLTSGTWSKYATWNYVPFTRVMMEMTQGGTAKIPPIMIYNTSRTFAQAITAAGTPGIQTGLLCNSTDPVIPANARYWDMTMKSGTNFTDANGAEDYIQGYGIGSWANSSANTTTAEGFTSIGRAGAWIGCPLDEGTHTFNAASNSGADSGFGFGGGCGNPAKTFSAGYAEWTLNSSINTLPGYVWVR